METFRDRIANVSRDEALKSEQQERWERQEIEVRACIDGSSK